ncbi:MAG: hypothetical protein N3A58_04700 [Spirochaetes bacterium]|nr:hypothetical protein [Spirochaetota bacterium]
MNRKLINIIFEGIDKTGKSTQVDLVYNFLSQNYNNYEIIKTKEPGNTKLGKNIRDILLSNDYNINILSEYFLFISDRIDNIFNIKKSIEKIDKKLIILYDRSHFSTFAYQIYPFIYENKNYFNILDNLKLKKIKAIDKKIGKLIFSIIKPDIIFYFEKRNLIKEFNEDRIESRKEDYFNIVLEGYKKSFNYYYNFNKKVIKLFFEDGIENNFNIIKNKIIKIIK